jgi:DNA-binding response OmpR family regulator
VKNLLMPTAKIALISADGNLTRSVTTCLLQAGYKVTHISHGSKAIELLHVEHPNLIVLDVELPDFNSLAIIRSLRSGLDNYRIPVILMGSKMREEDALIGLEAGADLCLLEIFQPQVFVARVRSLLRRVEQLKTD